MGTSAAAGRRIARPFRPPVLQLLVELKTVNTMTPRWRFQTLLLR